MTDTPPERDPAEIEPTDNSTGNAPDLGLVEAADAEAAECEHEGDREPDV